MKTGVITDGISRDFEHASQSWMSMDSNMPNSNLYGI